MQDFIEKINNPLLLLSERTDFVDQAVHILQLTFHKRSDQVVAAILEDKIIFEQSLMVLEAADKLNYHTTDLSSLRIRVLDVLVGIIRDFITTEKIKRQLQRDFQSGIILNKADAILYNTNLFLYGLIYFPDFDKALIFGKKALELISREKEMDEEKLRLFSNLIQYYSLTGEFDTAELYVKEGEKYFSLSNFEAYHALYILAVSTYFNEQGDFERVVSLIGLHRNLLENQKNYPSLYFFTLNQLSEAQLRKGDQKGGRKTLDQAETVARQFYTSEENSFFARWYSIKAFSQICDPNLFLSSKEMLERSLKIYEKLYCGPDKHKNQGSVHLLLAKLFYQHKDFERAQSHSTQSLEIFKKRLKVPKNVDAVELEALLKALERENLKNQ